MKTRSVVLAILVVAILATMLVPAVSAETQKLAFISAVSKAGGDAVFTFMIFGEFNHFDGTAYYNGQAYDLRCAPRGEKPDVLLCRGAATLGGKTVQVVVNGFSFITFVGLNEGYCNPVYDWGGGSADYPWVYYGDYCTPTQPAYGATAYLADYYSEGSSYWYEFLPNGNYPPYNMYGVGWYYIN
jgi:hypothetical protein